MKQCIILFVLAILIFSCGKQNDAIREEYGNIPVGLGDSLKQIGGQLQEFQIDPSKDNTITGRNGTVIRIPANSMLTEEGKLVMITATIQLLECYTLADIITNNLQTVHGKDILQTQGMILVTATAQDGKIIKISKDKPIRIEMPSTSVVRGAKIFQGKRDHDGHMNWDNPKDPSQAPVPAEKMMKEPSTRFDRTLGELEEIDTTEMRLFTAFDALDFGWINVDNLYDDPKAEAIKLMIKTNERPSIIKMILRNKRIMLDAYVSGENAFRFTSDEVRSNKLPNGDTVIILAIGYRENKIKFSSKEIILGKNDSEELMLEPITVSELRIRLEALEKK